MIESKKILILTESIDVNDSSGTKGRVALLESFKKIGYAVTVLHYCQKDIQLEGMNCISINELKGSPIYFLSRMQRVLYRWFQWDISKYVDTWFGFSFGFFNDVKSLSNALKKYNPSDYDMFWTLSKGNSYRTHAAALKHPRWYPKWYAYVHDPYPQQLYPRPYNFVPYGFKQKRFFFREVTLNCHRSVFPSLLLKEWMQSYYSSVKNKSLIIPHQLASVEVSKKYLPDYFNRNKFNLLHAGNLLDLRDPKPVVEAFQQFLQNHPEAKEHAQLLFIGKKSVFQEYLIQKQHEIPQLYVSKGYVDFKSVYAMQQNVSANIILEAKSEISPFLPGKFPHCVAANRPIVLVGPYYSETKRLLGKDHPYQFDFKEIEELANAFTEMYRTWKVAEIHQSLDRPDLLHYLSASYVKEILAEKSSVV